MKKRALACWLAISVIGSSAAVPVGAFEITVSESQGFEVTEEGTAIELTKPQASEDVVASEDAAASTDDKYADYQWYSIQVDSDGLVKDEIVLKMDGVWYFSTDQIEYYTDYVFNEEDMCFREDVERKSGGLSKAIAIDTSNNTAFVKAYLQQLDNIYEYNEQLYYPIHQLLPLMECTCGADGNVLYLENAEVSMVDALGQYVPEVVYYDAAEEFAGSKWANIIMVGSAYLFDTVGHADNWERLLGIANYVDYQAAAKDYLTKYDIYEQVMEFRNELTDTAKQGKTVKEESETLMNTYKFFEMVHDMLEAVGNEDDFYYFIPEDIWEEMGPWAKAADISGKAVEAVADYALMVKDHRDMLAAVYPEVEKDVNFTDQKLRGIKKVYDGYGGSVLRAIWSEIVEELQKEGFWYVAEKGAENLLGVNLGLYKLVADVGGNLMTKYVENLGIKASDAMALLNHHIIFTNEAKDKYNKLLQSGAYTQEKAEDIRLAALMTMISSKRCFEIIRDNNAYETEVVSYCNNRIAQIDEFLKKIYLAKDAVMVDGIEYFQKAPEMFLVQLENLNGTESEPPAPLSELEYFFRENYSKNDKMWLLDIAGNDGIEELLVVTQPDENNITYFRIYTTYDSEISMIFEEEAGAVPGERKAMNIMEDGYGNYAFFYYYPRVLQGGTAAIEVYALQTYGGRIYLRSETVQWESQLQDMLNDVVLQFYQLNPYWEELFNTLIGSEAEGVQNAFDYAGVVLGLPDHSELSSMSVSEKLEKYYWAYFSETDTRWMVDVTGDGEPELLVVSEDGGLINFYVYTVSGNSVSMIYNDVAEDSHAGQRALYLVDNLNGTYSFVRYIPSTWQDYRSICGEWFELGSDGYTVSLDCVYTDQDQDMYDAVYQFVSRMYPYSMNLQLIFDTLPESEKMEWTSAMASFRQEENLSGTPDEGSEWNNTSGMENSDEFTMNQEFEEDWSMEQSYAEGYASDVASAYNFGIQDNTESNSGYQMPEDIFWSISDPFGSYQLRFRNESDGCYMYLSNPSTGESYSTKCTLDFGTSIDIMINDECLLQQYVISFSQDFTGGGYNMVYNPETKQIMVVTNNGEWIELYFFDD